MLFISPPFGNYFQLKNAISIKGSFTLKPRSGLFFQIFKTLRYDFKRGGWVNKIGLRNPGIDYAIENYYKQPNTVISVAIMKKEEIPELNEKIPKDCDIELNISCPNVKKEKVYNDVGVFYNSTRKWCIVKLSPLDSIDEVDILYTQGFRQFHCCNTVPTERGGLSGKSLIPFSRSLIREINEKYPDTEIIGGGGITNMFDIVRYHSSGAVHYSVATLCFHPLLFYKLYSNYNIYGKFPLDYKTVFLKKEE
jgi:dihydroorotate dehydrogenase